MNKLEKLTCRQNFEIFKFTTQKSEYIYVEDVVESFYRTLTSDKDLGGKVIHVGRDQNQSVNEIIDALGNGAMTEAFGAGTAATIAPIKTIAFQSKKYNLPENNKISFSKKILDYLNNLKFGKIDDKFNWVNKL